MCFIWTFHRSKPSEEHNRCYEKNKDADKDVFSVLEASQEKAFNIYAVTGAGRERAVLYGASDTQ